MLWPASLRDTLLRLAETPRQYIPRWTDQIWAEVTRNLEARRKLTSEQIRHLVDQIKLHFPEAYVDDYEKLIPVMTNDLKDRHVAAAAVRCGAQVIVIFNLKDFPPESLADWDLEAQHPDEFLLHQYDLKPELVVFKLGKQAERIRRTLPQLLQTLRTGVPNFADTIAEKLGFDISVQGDEPVK